MFVHSMSNLSVVPGGTVDLSTTILLLLKVPLSINSGESEYSSGESSGVHKVLSAVTGSSAVPFFPASLCDPIPSAMH